MEDETKREQRRQSALPLCRPQSTEWHLIAGECVGAPRGYRRISPPVLGRRRAEHQVANKTEVKWPASDPLQTRPHQLLGESRKTRKSTPTHRTKQQQHSWNKGVYARTVNLRPHLTFLNKTKNTHIKSRLFNEVLLYQTKNEKLSLIT